MSDLIFEIVGNCPPYSVEVIGHSGGPWEFYTEGEHTISDDFPAGQFTVQITDNCGCVAQAEICFPVTTTTTTLEPTTTTTTTCDPLYCDYGLLYNWYAVDTGKLAPTGWHVPSDTEWTTLTDWLTANGYGYSGSGDDIAKSVSSICNWSSSQVQGTPGNDPFSNNLSGFRALSAGTRNYSSGGFAFINYGTDFWSSTSTWHRYLNYDSLYFNRANNDNKYGFSIRCVRDYYEGWEEDVPVIDYDGNEYDVVLIGTQLWLVQNLKVTHYNDGEVIPNVTDGTEWSNLVTGALCAYNNDWETYTCVPEPTTTITTEEPTTTTSTTTEEITTTTTSTTEEVTTTTTTEEPAFRMLFDAIGNAGGMISGDYTDVEDWNIFFDLPANGTSFTSCTIRGNEVKLFGGSGIKLRDYVFGDNDPDGTSLLEVIDEINCIVECGNGIFSDYNIGYGCYELTKVYLPFCTILGNEVFADCVLLDDLNLPFSVFTSLGDYVFNNCQSLPQYYFANLTNAGEGCFGSYPNLINPDFSSLITAGDNCFNYCDNLTNPDFSSLTTAGAGCFLSCHNLTTPDFSSLESVGNRCFSNCTKLINVSFPLLIYAGNLAFSGCVLLDNISFPSLITAGNYCFYNCYNIITLNLPVLENIGDYGFYGILKSEYKSSLILNLPSCINLGTTTGDDYLFQGTGGISVTITIPSALMTCNGGSPDGDIQFLQANNTVTVLYSDVTTSTTTTSTTSEPTTTTTTTTSP